MCAACAMLSSLRNSISGAARSRSGRRAGHRRCPAEYEPLSALRRRLERPRDFFRAVALDTVAHLDVVEVLDADTALEPFADLANVVLEPAQRGDGALEDLDRV